LSPSTLVITSGPEEDEVREVEVEHVGRGIDRTQGAVGVEGRAREVGAESPGQHDLDGLARRDQLLRADDALLELLLREVARRLAGDGLARRRRGSRAVAVGLDQAELALDPLDPLHGPGIVRFRILPDAEAADDPERVHQVVEDEGVAGDHEHAVRDIGAALAGDVRQAFPAPRDIVAEVADCSSGEWRKVARPDPGPRPHEIADRAYGVGGSERA
jgi:hypothetical protein